MPARPTTRWERTRLVVSVGVVGLVVVSGGVGRPQGQVVSEQLHDQRRVLVRVLVQRVQLGNRVIERLQ